MPSRREFRRPSSTAPATGSQCPETEDFISIQIQKPVTPSGDTSPTGMPWRELINWMFDQVNAARLEEKALERLEWGEGANVVQAVLDQLREDFCGFEPTAP